MTRQRPRSSRPRADCPACGRSIAVTFDARVGTAFLRAGHPPRRGVRRAEAVTRLDELGHRRPEYHGAMWMLLSVMARRQAIIADSLRRSRALQGARDFRAKARGEKVAP